MTTATAPKVRKRACGKCKAHRHEPPLWLSAWHFMDHIDLRRTDLDAWQLLEVA